jgi:hypothetical protein
MNAEEQKVISQLRAEYFDLFPVLEKLHGKFSLDINCALKECIINLKNHQKIEIHTRIKDCDSAVNALRMDQEMNCFKSDVEYTLKDLNDC